VRIERGLAAFTNAAFQMHILQALLISHWLLCLSGAPQYYSNVENSTKALFYKCHTGFLNHFGSVFHGLHAVSLIGHWALLTE